jgi:hypothetical protein
MAGEALVFEQFPLSTAARDANDLTASAIDASAGDIANCVWTMHQPYNVMRVGVQIVTDIVYGTVPTLAVVAVDRRRLIGTDTGALRQELGRVTIPLGAKAGQKYYVNVPNGPSKATGDCLTGDQLLGTIKTAGLGGTVTGTFKVLVWGQPGSEADGNDKNAAGLVMSIEDTTTVQV